MTDWRGQANRIAAEARGRRGEDEAALFLEGLGFEIIARRVKTPRGEVDLIARAGLTVFAEVKWRARPKPMSMPSTSAAHPRCHGGRTAGPALCARRRGYADRRHPPCARP
jgi:hypothetical protein